MDGSSKISWLIILLLPIVVLGTLGDQELSVNGAKLIWNNNSQTFSIAASGSMSESVNYIWPVADATSGGQALLSDGSGLLSWGTPTTSAAHDILSATHSDATANAVTRGSLIYGNSTPKWDELVIGANQKVFVSDGTDPSWGTVDISGGTNLAVDTDHLKLTSDTVGLSDNQDTNLHYWQGSFLEQIDFTISEAGGTVTGSLEKEGTGDLIMFFSDEYTILDCTPAVTVNLTSLVGSDTAPAMAFVYVPQSTKTLTAGASWPAASVEHIRVASIVLQSAATTGTDGALMNRNWNDMAFGITDPRGHSLHASERLRFEHALHNTGVVLSITGSGTGTVTLDITSGTVFQFHLHTFPAVDMAGAGDIHLVNLSGSEYSITSNLVAGITTLADGVTSLGNNKYFNIVVWGVQNRTGETSHLMCNLPIGQYTKSADATVDSSKFSVYTIPSAFRGTGFLIAELTFQLTGGGTTWTTVQNRDLLGQTPTLTPGGGTTTNITIFSDSAFEIFDNADDAKRGDFELSGITTGNTRTLTWPDVSTNMWADDGSVPLTANWDVGAFDIRAQTGTFDSLTSGRVAFISTNGLLIDDADITFSTDTLTVTGLTVTNAAAINSNSVVFQPNADSTIFFQVLDADGGTPVLNVDTTNERVGIGTASPAAALHIKTGTGIQAMARMEWTDATKFGGLEFLEGETVKGGFLAIGSNFATASRRGDLDFQQYGATGKVSFWTGVGPSRKMTIANDGDIGIGTINPSAKIEINDSVINKPRLRITSTYEGAGHAGVEFFGVSGNPATFVGGLFFNQNDERISLWDGTAERITILQGGDVGIGEIAPETLTEWTHADPNMTWGCSTHTDDDEARKTTFNFKGQQSGGEETTLVRQQASHDGPADDEKGKYEIFINDGNDGDSPTLALVIDSSQTITTGIWGATDVGISFGGTGQSSAQAAINALSAVSGATNEHVLTKDTGTGNAVWKVTTAVGGDEKVKIDAAATAGYIGAANNDGVLRTSTGLSYTDGGDFITLAFDGTQTDGDDPNNVDSESNAMLKAHAYLAQTSGFVNAFIDNDENALSGYVGNTNNPAGAGTLIARNTVVGNAANDPFIFLFVGNGKYFEIVAVGTPTIIWTPLVSGGAAPIDQD